MLGEAMALTPAARAGLTPPARLKENTDLLAMTQWAKSNSPDDSLFYNVDFETSFRYFAERSLLLGYPDFGMMAIYGGIEPVDLVRMKQALTTDQRGQPAKMTAYLVTHGVNYVIARRDSPVDLTSVTVENIRYSPIEVFKNGTYIVYQLAPGG
jgi:hypothetical protein